MIHDTTQLPHVAATAARRLLVVFPHPDDESYGVAGTLCRYGDDPDAATVLMTLTRGEAARAGLEEGLTPAEQGERRTERMHRVAEICALDGLLLRDYPDSRLAAIDPRPMERDVGDVIAAFRPQVVISFGARGINAHPDHITTHGVVKRALLAARDRDSTIGRRLATMTAPDSFAEGIDRLVFSYPEEAIDMRLDITPWAERKEACLRIHDAFATVIGADGYFHRPPIEYFRLWGESPDKQLDDLFSGI